MENLQVSLRNNCVASLVKSLYLLLFFILLEVPQAHGQETVVDHQLWFDVVPNFDINDKLRYFGDLSYRTSTSADNFKRLVLRPSLRFKAFKGFELLGGLGIILTWEDADYNTLELRPSQGFRFSWPKLWRMNFDHRFQIEERLIWNNEGEFDPNLRFRYRLKSKLPINKSIIVKNTLYIPFSYEFFANVGPNVVEKYKNRGRAMIGLGYVFPGKWTGEFELTFQRSSSSEIDELTLSDRIFRFKLIYDGWVF